MDGNWNQRIHFLGAMDYWKLCHLFMSVVEDAPATFRKEVARYSKYSLHFLSWDFLALFRGTVNYLLQSSKPIQNKAAEEAKCLAIFIVAFGVGNPGPSFLSHIATTNDSPTLRWRRWNEISWRFWPRCLTTRLGELSSLEPCRCRVNRMNGKMVADCPEGNEESFLFYLKHFFSENQMLAVAPKINQV